jgi:ankyrin repeat protein
VSIESTISAFAFLSILTKSSLESGFTPLMQAALEDHPATVQLLVAFGAEVDARDLSGKTALVHATWCQHANTVAALLECGADVDAEDKWGDTALLHAPRRGNRDILQMLKEAKAETLLRDDSGRKPLTVGA